MIACPVRPTHTRGFAPGARSVSVLKTSSLTGIFVQYSVSAEFVKYTAERFYWSVKDLYYYFFEEIILQWFVPLSFRDLIGP